VLVKTPVEQRGNPLPVFAWADSGQMWEMMMSREELAGYRRDSSWFMQHQLLQPRMRTILLDWLMEVISSFSLCKVKLCFSWAIRSIAGSRDVHETFWAETETRPETYVSETETRPRRSKFCPRRDRDETLWFPRCWPMPWSSRVSGASTSPETFFVTYGETHWQWKNIRIN